LSGRRGEGENGRRGEDRRPKTGVMKSVFRVPRTAHRVPEKKSWDKKYLPC